MTLLLASCALACALTFGSDPLPFDASRVRIETSAVQGLGPQLGVGRRDPSDLIRIGKDTLVLFTRLKADAPLYPEPFAGEIWYARSSDEGQSWTEEGLLLGHGPSGSFDSIGVFDPNVVRNPDGSYSLFYSGVGPRFNFRFEDRRRVEPIRIGRVRLLVDEEKHTLRAERGPDNSPVYSPSPRELRGFDSLRVSGATPILRNGLIHLYYRARMFGHDGSASTLGLAIAEGSDGRLTAAHEQRTVLPYSGDAMLMAYKGGVLALLTNRARGLYWAPDGEHFARMPARVLGQLESPGSIRAVLRAENATAFRVWGLHVGGLQPDPYLERFEFELSDDLAVPPDAALAIPSSAQPAHWPAQSNWIAQHRSSLAQVATRPRDYVFLGDELTEGFGGHSRVGELPGVDAWRRLCTGKEAINLGLAGDATQHALWRLDHGALDQARARVVVVELGRNNVGTDTARDISAGLEAILRRVLHELPFTEVVVISVLPRPGDDADKLQAVADCNRELARFQRWPRVHYVDPTAEFADATGAAKPEMFAPSGVALSAAGYEKWTSALEPLLKKIEALVPEGAAQELGELEQDR